MRRARRQEAEDLAAPDRIITLNDGSRTAHAADRAGVFDPAPTQDTEKLA